MKSWAFFNMATFFLLLFERAVIALQDTARLQVDHTVVTICPCVINFGVRMENVDCKKGRG